MNDEQENSWNKELPAPISKRYTTSDVARAIEKAHGVSIRQIFGLKEDDE